MFVENDKRQNRHLNYVLTVTIFRLFLTKCVILQVCIGTVWEMFYE